MVMDWSQMPSAVVVTGSVVGALVTIGGGFAVVHAKIIKPVKTHIDDMKTKLQVIPGMQSQLNEVFKEVKPNSGTSLKDRVEEAIKKVHENTVLTQTVAAFQRAKLYLDPLPAFFCDGKGEVVGITAGYTRLTGLELAGLVKEGWKRAVHPDDLPEVLKLWHDSLRTGTIFVHEFKYINRAMHSVTSCRVIAEPITVDGAAGVQGWAGRIEEVVGAAMEEPDDQAIEAVERVLTRSSNAARAERDRSRATPDSD